MTEDECIFCKIACHKIESRIVYEDEHAIGILDAKPRFAKGQCVVFSKKHVAHVYDLEEGDALWLFKGIKAVAKKMEKLYKLEHVAIFVRGRTISHAHAILFPTFPVEEDMLSQFLKPMILYNPLAQISELELDEIAAKLRSL